MGEIEVDQRNVPKIVRVGKAFGGMKNNVFVFTKQDKTGFAINETKSPADSHFNRWRVDPVPLNQMIMVDEAKMHSLFPSDVLGAPTSQRL